MGITADHLRDLSDLFAGVPTDALDQLSDRLPANRFGKGELIHSPFDRAESLYMVEQGRVRLYRSAADGRQLTLSMLDAGAVFGRLAGQERETYDCYAEALEDCCLRTLRPDELDRLINHHPQIAQNLLSALSQRLSDAEDQLESIAFHSVPSRLAAMLLRLMDRYGRVTPAGIRIDQRFTHMQLAEMVGTSRETLTKVINELREAGMVDVRERMVWVLDADRLEQLKRRG